MFSQGEDLLQCPPPKPIVMDRRWKPNVVELAPNCPRCHSSNTKFCYYNNYSLTQPRYFCKSCRRYWTKGGSLRNVPVGGGCRKNRRAKSVPISTGSLRPGHQSSDPFANSHSPDPNAMASSTNQSMSDSSTIDLAVVYAKFLDQRPNPNPGPELPREFDQLPQNLDSPVQFPHELVGSHGATVSDDSPVTQLGEGQQVLFNEFVTLEDTNNYGLQPLPLLPAEDIGIQDMLWSNSLVVGSNFSWQGTTQLQGFDQAAALVHDDHSTIHSNPLDDNWNSFDLPSFEASSRP